MKPPSQIEIRKGRCDVRYHDKRIILIVALAVLTLVVFAVMAQEPPLPPAPELHEEIRKNLPPVCLDAEHAGKPVSGCPSTRQRFSSATEASLVRVCPGNPKNEPTCADYSTVKWKRFADVKGSGSTERELVEVCTADKEEGSVISGGNCKASASGSTWSGMAFRFKEDVSHLPPLPPATFTISPVSGVSPVDVTLTWNVPGMTGTFPCTATGDWEGQKAAASTEVIQSVMRNASYTLTCTHIPPGGVVASWTKPVTNTDGTPLANPSGYLLSYGNSMLAGEPVLSSSVAVPYAQTSYLFSDLLPMRWFFAIQTTAADNGISKLSNVATWDVKPRTAQIQRFTATVAVTVTQEPSPPGTFTVAEPTAYKLEEKPNELSAEQVGTVPIGTPCDDDQPVLGKYVVAREKIVPAPGEALPNVVVAVCKDGSLQPARKKERAR